MIDYKEIVENLEDERIKQLLDSFGIPFKETDTYLVMPTVCHNEDADEASWKLYYYKNSHMFMCFTECQSMSIFTFLKHYYETRQIEYDWYQDIYQVIINCSSSNLTTSRASYKSIRDNYIINNKVQLPTYPDGILDCFIHFYPVEWIKDHITPDVMDKYNIKFSPTQNKIIIPHYNINNELVGIRGRALNKYDIENFGKYMPVQIEGKWYSHPLSLNLYGLNKNWKNIKEDGICYIFESEKSVMQAEGFGMKNYGVACCGSHINKFQIELLLRYCAPRYVVVCFDNEEEENSDKYFQKLWKMCKKYTNYCNMSFIYDRQNMSKKKDSPTDNGEKTFIELLERRVIVK